MKYTVYKHTFPNKKVYIGITNRKPEERFRKDGSGYNNCPKMINAIKKYGWENVEHEILFENLTQDQAEKKEKELICKYKSNQTKYGYNIANGGNHRGKCSEETKNKIREKNIENGTCFKKGQIPWNKGKKMPREIVEKIRIKRIGYRASEETRLKQSLALKGRKMSKEAIQKAIATKKEKYPNGWLTKETREIIRQKNIGRKQSKETIEKRIHTIKEKYKNGYVNKLKGVVNEKSCKKVNQYDLDGNFIKTWNSITEAARFYNINISNISSCCKGRRKQVSKYQWKFFDGNTNKIEKYNGRYRN